MVRNLLLLIAGLTLVACAAAGPATYGPADEKGFGFEETRIEDDRYRVVYRGSGGMPPEQVEDYALLRASELALSNGYEWFRIIGSNITREQRGGVSLGAGVGGGSYGRRSGASVGVGGNFGKVGARDYFTAQLEVLMGNGEPPQDDDVYNAAEVASSIAPAVPVVE